MLVGVTANPASVDAAKIRLNPPPAPPEDAPAPPPPPPPPPPPDFTLTSGFDDFVGTSASERIEAPVGTLQSGDLLSGNGGTDTLVATLHNANTDSTLFISSIGNIELTVSGSNQLDATNVSGVTKYTLTGSGNLTFSAGLIAGGVEIDASALTGNLAIAGTPLGAMTIKGGSGNDTIKGSSAADTLIGGSGNDSFETLVGNDTLTGGDGDDTVTMTAALVAGQSLDGGNGTDTLEIQVSQGDLGGIKATGFELLRVNSGSNPINVDTSFIAQTGLSIALAGTGNVTLEKLASGTTVSVQNTMPTLALSLAVPGGGADNLKLKLADSVTLTTLSYVVGLETLNIVLDGAAGTTSTITNNSVIAAQVLTGSANLTVTNALATTSFDASAFTGDLNAKAGGTATTLKGGSGNDTLQGGAGADTLVGGDGNDTIQLGAAAIYLPNGTGADTITTGTGNDVVRFVASAINGNGAATNYAAFAHITDFALASDKLAFSANNSVFGAAVGVVGLSKGANSKGLNPGDAMVVQTVAKDASATATTDVSFIKLTTAVAFTTDVKGTFAAALGSAVIDSLAVSSNYLISAYDTTNQRMVLAVVNVDPALGSDTNLDNSDFTPTGISVVGVLSMSATDYANFGVGQLAAAF